MHSSRMHTVPCSGRLGGGGGVCLGGVWQTPLWTEWQTSVKTLTYRNYVAGGNLDVSSRRMDGNDRRCL